MRTEIRIVYVCLWVLKCRFFSIQLHSPSGCLHNICFKWISLELRVVVASFISFKRRDSLHHIHRHEYWYAKSVIHAYKMNNFFVWMTLFEIACERAKQTKQLSKKDPAHKSPTQMKNTFVEFNRQISNSNNFRSVRVISNIVDCYLVAEIMIQSVSSSIYSMAV